MLGAAFEWAAEDEQRSLAALARHAGMLWPDFAARLERLGGGPVELLREGALVVARTAVRSGMAEELAAACQARGLPVHTADRCRIWPRASLRWPHTLLAALLLPR